MDDNTNWFAERIAPPVSKGERNCHYRLRYYLYNLFIYTIIIHSAAIVDWVFMLEHVHTRNKNFGVHSLVYLIDVVTFSSVLLTVRYVFLVMNYLLHSPFLSIPEMLTSPLDDVQRFTFV